MDNVFEIHRKKAFTREEAQSLLPIIFRLTEDASKEVQSLVNRIKAISDSDHPSSLKLESELNGVIERWQSKIKKLGAEPKGLWMADFDNGTGYYCWKYPENEINHWHGYQDGYSGRIVIE